MSKKILIMGLSGAGKTSFAMELLKQLSRSKKIVLINADEVRHQFNDWDFTIEGRLKQAQRMKELSLLPGREQLDFVVADFIAPLKAMRDIFGADYTVWINTEQTSNYPDTDIIFEKPESSENVYVVTDKDVANTVPPFIDILLRNP